MALTKKQLANRKRHNFLIKAFFENIDGYAVNDSVDGWVLVKHINGDTGEYEVAIYTREAYDNYENYSNGLGIGGTH